MKCQKLPDWKKLPELKNLLDLSLPPKEIFYQGKWEKDIFKNCVAVVGSRRMTDYGQRVIEKLVPQLVFEGKTVVSGFMYGTDQCAHMTATENGGKTVAVLGWGINIPLAGNDLKLANKIIECGGLILSEWENQKGARWTFPVRDRIIAALAQEVYIVEAAEKSGALITARIAAKLKRKIYAVPGPIISRTSVGTNGLISTGLAQMWLGKNEQQKIDIDDPILNILENETLTADEMARKLFLPVAEIGTKLTMLVLSGQVVERGGKYFLNDDQ